MAMAAMAEAAAAAMEAEKSEKERNGEVELDLAKRLESAVTARATYIKDHAQSLTMVNFRRLLEEDLGMETSALDPHKKKIKELVDHIMNADDPAPEVSEVAIRDAVAKRSSYLRTESRNMKFERVRRLLEEDLGLEKFTLDTKKELVKSLLDEVLNTSDVTKEEEPSASEVEALDTETATANEEKNRPESTEKSRKKKKLVKKREETDESEREESEENKPRKRKSGKRKAIAKQLEESEEEDSDEGKPSKSSKDKVHAKKLEESEGEDTKEYNEDSDDSPGKKTSKKKATKASEPKPIVSKVVEQLKQMIKTSGMNIPPSVYKRVKQVPEAKRESSLIKELESILQKEGLNRNSSEKELKAVRKKKDKQKDLEGIDVGNIITEGRGRRQANMFYEPLPVVKKRKKAVVSDDGESSQSEEEKKQGSE